MFALFALVRHPWLPRPAWTSASVEPAPDEWFRFLMFPQSANVPLYDAPDGNAVGTLARAVANSPTEVLAGGWIEVQEPDAALWVRSSDLTFLPPATGDYVNAFERVYRQSSGDSSRYVWFWVDYGEQGHWARLRLGNEDGFHESEYTILNGTAHPERLVLLSGAAAGFMMLADWLPGVGAALLTLVVVSVVARRMGRRAANHTQACIKGSGHAQ